MRSKLTASKAEWKEHTKRWNTEERKKSVFKNTDFNSYEDEETLKSITSQNPLQKRK